MEGRMMASRKAPLACSSPATFSNHTLPTRKIVSSMARKRLKDKIKHIQMQEVIKKFATVATNLLDCSSSTGCAPPTLCTSIRPVRERERKERSKTKEWKKGGIHNSSLQNSDVWHKLTCHSCRSSEGSGLQLPPLGHQNLPVVGQCQQQLLQSCLRRRGGEEEGQGRIETIGRRWKET